MIVSSPNLYALAVAQTRGGRDNHLLALGQPLNHLDVAHANNSDTNRARIGASVAHDPNSVPVHGFDRNKQRAIFMTCNDVHLQGHAKRKFGYIIQGEPGPKGSLGWIAARRDLANMAVQDTVGPSLIRQESSLPDAQPWQIALVYGGRDAQPMRIAQLEQRGTRHR